MYSNNLHYLPLTQPFFALLVGLVVLVVVYIEVRVIHTTYMRLGIGPRAAAFLLIGSLLGSYFNIPIARLPGRQAVTEQAIQLFGERYAMPVAVDWPGTVIAINVGGALIPLLMSLYLLQKNRLWGLGAVAVAIVSVVCHQFATPVAGMGISLPVFVPALTSAIVALVLSREYAAPLAYVGGSLGTLVGADLSNLGKVQDIGAPIASIGGAGTFDGVFVCGILAVVLASLTGLTRKPRDTSAIG